MFGSAYVERVKLPLGSRGARSGAEIEGCRRPTAAERGLGALRLRETERAGTNLKGSASQVVKRSHTPRREKAPIKVLTLPAAMSALSSTPVNTQWSLQGNTDSGEEIKDNPHPYAYFKFCGKSGRAGQEKENSAPISQAGGCPRQG